MEILAKTPARHTETFIAGNKCGANDRVELTDLIMDLYNRQIKMGNSLRKDIQLLTDRIEFVFPNDAKRFTQVIEQHVKLSQASLLTDMQQMLRLSMRNPCARSKNFHTSNTKQATAYNADWTKELTEQLCILKDVDSYEPHSEQGEFYYYEIVE